MSRSDEIWHRLPDPLRRVVQRARVRAGHFYSPYPDLADLRGREESVFGDHDHFAGVDLAVADQLAMIEDLKPLTRDLPWGEPGRTLRYSVDNRLYGHGDGVITAAMLRHLSPRRYVEIGSGHSTLLALDVNDIFLDGQMSLTAIDPNPDTLYELLGAERPPQLRLLTSPIQSLPVAVVGELGPGDVLFVDSTHVVKAGSDVNHIIFELLPALESGVYVHFHDIFGNFEYPSEWVYQRRAWSEAYLVRAFLQFNSEFEVVLFTSWLRAYHQEALESLHPELKVNPGASLWIRRR